MTKKISKLRSCLGCDKELNEFVNELKAVNYPDNCRGKKCLECGKIRNLGVVRVVWFERGLAGECLRCKQMKTCEIEGICNTCFYDTEAERGGCVCVRNKPLFYCTICKARHDPLPFCEECFDKQYNPKYFFITRFTGRFSGVNPAWVVFPSLFAGIIFGLVFGKFIWGKRAPKFSILPKKE